MQVITDACIKITVAELCFEKKTKEYVVETFKKCFAGFCQQIFGRKKYFRQHFRKNQQKTCHI